MTRTPALFKLAAVFGLAAPVLVLASALATRAGWLSFDTGFGLLTLRVAPMVAWAGVAVGLVMLGLWAWKRQAPLWVAALALVVPVAGLVAFGLVLRHADGFPPVHETATDWTEPLAFSRSTRDGGFPVEADPRVPETVGAIRAAWAPWAGRRVAEINAETCPGARTVPRLASEREVADALRAEGVRVLGSAVWRVEGDQESPWFGRERDVVVRLKPGATDVRVSERVGLTDMGQTCRLATAIVERLRR